MELVPNLATAGAFFEAPHSESELLWFLWHVLDVIRYLHANNVVHLDIKPTNILVRGQAPLVSDLGAAKVLSVDTSRTLLVGTEGFMYPEMLAFMTERPSGDPNRRRGYAVRAEVRPAWDLFALGKTLNQLLAILERTRSDSLSPYAKRYLRLMAYRLLDGHESEDERPEEIGQHSSQELRYLSAEDALRDLDKVVGRFQLEVEVPELNRFNPETIQVSSHAPTVFTPRVASLVDSNGMKRLGSTTQLGLLTLVYPTATHTRLEHSIGTYSVCCQYISALHADALNPLFRQLMNVEDIEAVLVAALFHDLGQYPMAHDLEEVDKELFRHDEMTLRVLMSDEVAALLKRDWHVSVERVSSVLSATSGKARMSGTLRDRILHSMISGPIDSDKIDYLTRDSAALALAYGAGIDIDRLLTCLTVVYARHPSGETFAALGIHEKGRVIAESIAFARYAMHRQVYWHHAFRAIKAMLATIVRSALATADEAGSLKSFMAEFRAFVSARIEEQPTLRVSTGVDPGVFGRISASDRRLLVWFVGHAANWAPEMQQMIEEREMYRRVLVISGGRADTPRLIDDLLEIGTGVRTWRRQTELQRAFQNQVVQLVQEKRGHGVTSDILEPNSALRFVADSSRLPLLLVDVPPDKTEVPLEYVIEEGRVRTRLEGFSVASLERSVIWMELQNNFRRSAGKVRVYCHRDHADFVGGYLTRAELEAALEAAVRVVQNEGGA